MATIEVSDKIKAELDARKERYVTKTYDFAIANLLADSPERMYQCQKCGAVIKSTDHKIIPIEPDECWEDQGGCGRKTKFKDITLRQIQMGQLISKK